MRAKIAFKIVANPSVEAPLIIYASLDKVEVKIEGAWSLSSNHPMSFFKILK